MKITPVSYNNYTHKKTDKAACKNHSSIQADSSYPLANNNTQSIGNTNRSFVSFGKQIRVDRAPSDFKIKVGVLAQACLDKLTDENFRELHDAMLPLIEILSRRYEKAGVRDELIDEGRITLFDLVRPWERQYQPRNGKCFYDYAADTIHWRMMDLLREQNRQEAGITRVSPLLARSLKELKKKLGHDPTLQEAKANFKELGEKHADDVLERALNRGYKRITTRLDDSPSSCDSNASLSGVISDPAATAEQELLRNRVSKQLCESVNGLKPKQRRVLTEYYYEGLSLKEIGEELEVTESRACQIHGKAIGVLKKRLERRGDIQLSDVV